MENGIKIKNCPKFWGQSASDTWSLRFKIRLKFDDPFVLPKSHLLILRPIYHLIIRQNKTKIEVISNAICNIEKQTFVTQINIQFTLNPLGYLSNLYSKMPRYHILSLEYKHSNFADILFGIRVWNLVFLGITKRSLGWSIEVNQEIEVTILFQPNLSGIKLQSYLKPLKLNLQSLNIKQLRKSNDSYKHNF